MHTYTVYYQSVKCISVSRILNLSNSKNRYLLKKKEILRSIILTCGLAIKKTLKN